MFKPLLLIALSTGLLGSFAPLHAAAQSGKNNNKNNNNKNDERKENEAVQKAQKDVTAAKKVFGEAEKSARQAAEKLQSAIRDQSKAAGQIQRRRDDLETKHADLVGLTEARRNLDTARKAYEIAGAPILKQVAATAGYKEAVEAAKSADRRLAALREDGAGDDGDRLKQMADAAKTKQLPSRLEREALDAEESLKPERKELKATEESVAKANDAMEKAVERDPELKSAKEAFERAKDRVAAARRESVQETKQLADARQKLTREQNDLQQKINADNKDDNKSKNKTNKK